MAVLVLLSHSPELTDGDRHREILTRLFHTVSFGELALDGFFVLSGYLICQSWQRDPHLLAYLKKRCLRIYPGFIVAALVSVFVVGALGAQHASAYYSQLALPSIFKGMLMLGIASLPPVFAGQPYPHVNGAMWTIVFEFRCYLLVAVLGVIGLLKRQVLLGLFVLASVLPSAPFLVSKMTSVPSWQLWTGDPVQFIRLLTFFCAGGCFYLFRDLIRYRHSWALAAFAVLLVGLFWKTSAQLVLSTAGAYILFWFAFARLPMLQQFGTYSDISYGVYLYGWPAQKLLLWYIPSLSPWGLFVLACGLSFTCGLLSWHLVERPFMHLKTRRSSNITADAVRRFGSHS